MVAQDIDKEWAWHPREYSSTRRIHPKVHFLSTDDHNFLDMDLHVHYTPPRMARKRDNGSPRTNGGSEEYSYTMQESMTADDSFAAFAHDDDNDGGMPEEHAVRTYLIFDSRQRSPTRVLY